MAPLRLGLDININQSTRRQYPPIEHEFTPSRHIRYRRADLDLTRQQLVVTIDEAELRMAALIAAKWRTAFRPALSRFASEDYSFATLVEAESEIVDAFRFAVEPPTADDYIEVRAVVQTLQKVTGLRWGL